MNQIARRERGLITGSPPSWLGVNEHASDMFFAAVGMPPAAGLSQHVGTGFFEYFAKTQPAVCTVTLLRTTLYLVSLVALLRLFLPRSVLEHVLKWTRFAVAVSLAIALAWLVDWHLPVGSAIRDAIATLYLVVFLSLATIGVSTLVLGRGTSVSTALLGPNIGLVASAVAAGYLVLKCSTKVPVNYPFDSSDRLASFVQARNWIASWALASAAVSIAWHHRHRAFRLWTPRDLVKCAAAGGALLVAQPLASDARLNLGLPPDWSHVASLTHCMPLDSSALAITLEDLQNLSKDQVYFIKNRSLAIDVPLDAVLGAYPQAICRLCHWSRELFIVVDQVKWTKSYTLGPIPRLDYTCSPGALKLDCELDGDTRIADRTFRSLVTATSSTIVPLGHMCATESEGSL
ncbi:MAG: hypothetical protein QM784_11345 [Polyangiaceae bacterium]